MPLTQAGIPSAAGRGSRNWPRSARVAAAGRGEAGSFRRSAAGRLPRLEAVPAAGQGPQPALPRPALPTHASADQASRGPRAVTVSDAGARETRARGHPSLSSRPARNPGLGKGERQKDAGEGVPTLPRTPRARPGPYS